MTKEEIYKEMARAEQKNVRLVLADGKEYRGYADVFESRYDNSDDPEPLQGFGLMHLTD